MNKILCPSLLNVPSEFLKDEVIALDKAGADIFHVDIMDAHFVPNFGMSLHELSLVRSYTDKLIDVHLMVQDPGRYIELFVERGADIIYIHPEADQHPARSLKKIRDLGKIPGIAINPGTSIETIHELFPLVDYVTVMSVNPGFAGQTYLDHVEPKIKKLAQIQKAEGFHTVIDGGVDWENMKRLADYGIEGYVLGIFTLFNQEEKDYKVLMDKMRAL